jgi:hypothetical protein
MKGANRAKFFIKDVFLTLLSKCVASSRTQAKMQPSGKRPGSDQQRPRFTCTTKDVSFAVKLG